MAKKKVRSVLPRIKAQVEGDTARLMDAGDTRRRVALFALVPLVIFIMAGAMFYAWLDSGEWLVFGFAVVVTVPGCLVTWRLWREWKVVSTFEPAILEVRPWPIRLGEAVSLHYTRTPRDEVNPRYVAAEVEVEEEASYTVGSETRTVTHTVWKQDLEREMVVATQSRAPISAGWRVIIPADRPASFNGHHNEIGWSVTTTLHYGQGKSDDSTFTLLVVPELAPVEVSS